MVAAEMMSGEQLQGSIDQVLGLVYFQTDTSEDTRSHEDEAIQETCRIVSSITDSIAGKHPEWVEGRL